MLARTKAFSLTMAALLVLTLVPGAPFGYALRQAQASAQGRPTTAAPPRTRISRIQTDYFDQSNDPLNPANPPFSTADAENVEFVGHIGGATYAVAVQGDYAYPGVGLRLIDALSQGSGLELYITNRLSSEISILDTSSNTVVATIPIGSGPQGITIKQDSSRAYTADSDSDWISVVDLADNSVVTTIPAGDGPVIPALNSDGSRVYVASHLSNSVTVIDTSTNSVVTTISDVRWL